MSDGEYDGRRWFEFAVSVFGHFEVEAESVADAVAKVESQISTGDLEDFAINEGEEVRDGVYKFGCSTFGIFYARATDGEELSQVHVRHIDIGDFEDGPSSWLNYVDPAMPDDVDEDAVVEPEVVQS
ncbi:hypothetical protein NDI85_19810 [Halomicroarcula sp. S1AR25-4]|uniref:hypothetical protein n=1 Tax=Haloarcula sp. S1AR25-4 TaxID=2950538 RepID=UPI002876A61A|nr:hypothetical protein [Halomicroarcula sp. S1AR25-4]MDS0280034.1 hypothetical protein [Halomicroarcula sp. S1AR25-4]